MKSRRRHHGHGGSNHERWVISYADFVTLLFAFFVVLFATSNADREKARAVSESVKAAFSQGKHADVQAAIEAVKAEKIAKPKDEVKNSAKELLSTEELLRNQLKTEIEKGEIELHREPRGLVISFKQAGLFDSGDAVVKGSALPAMAKLADAMEQIPNQVRLEGHTDNRPIYNDRFKNNWELSSARSIAFLQIITSKFHMPLRRLAVSGYADVAPIAENTSDDGRARNRRVDVVILSSLAAAAEPSAHTN